MYRTNGNIALMVIVLKGLYCTMKGSAGALMLSPGCLTRLSPPHGGFLAPPTWRTAISGSGESERLPRGDCSGGGILI